MTGRYPKTRAMANTHANGTITVGPPKFSRAKFRKPKDFKEYEETQGPLGPGRTLFLPSRLRVTPFFAVIVRT